METPLYYPLSNKTRGANSVESGSKIIKGWNEAVLKQCLQNLRIISKINELEYYYRPGIGKTKERFTTGRTFYTNESSGRIFPKDQKQYLSFIALSSLKKPRNCIILNWKRQPET